MLSRTLAHMSRSGSRAAARTQLIAQHMMSTSTATSTGSTTSDNAASSNTHQEPSVLFETNQNTRIFTLNRPEKLNTLTAEMLQRLRPKITEWAKSDLCGTIIGTGAGRAFCAGGDIIQIAKDSSDPATRQKAIDFFHDEFGLDFILSGLDKPYVAILDGFTMGGGVGLSAHAPFRIATENTVFAMPETKIGYTPDVGATYFLSRLDGYLGTYLALTSQTVKGRGVFELGFATHYIPSRRVPILISRLAALENPSYDLVNSTIEELCSEEQQGDVCLPLVGDIRRAIDTAFSHDTVEDIIRNLRVMEQDISNTTVATWAKQTLQNLDFVSPTSLKIALHAIRAGKDLDLLTAFNEELKVSTAFCNGASADFQVGIQNLLNKGKGRPQWSPSSVDEVSLTQVKERFFSSNSEFLENAPALSGHTPERDPMAHALPSEVEIAQFVRGSHKSGGDSGITLQELIARVEGTRPGKLGVKKKVEEVAARQCKVVDNKDGNFVWLNWAPRRWQSKA